RTNSFLLRGGGAAVEIHGKIDKRAYSHAGAAFAGPRLGIIEPGRTGYIQVNPGRIASEFAEKPGGDDGTGAASAADVLNIGDGALDQIAVIVIERHAPHFFSGALCAGEDAFGKSSVGAENAGVDVAQGDD